MRYHGYSAAFAFMVLILALPAFSTEEYGLGLFKDNAASRNCLACHERFYTRWSSSHHGLSMQPYSARFAQARLKPCEKEILIGKNRYRVDVGTEPGWVEEISPRDSKKYMIAQVMGGKNVYFFLTPFEKGRHQILPVAYDIHKKEWFDMTKSGIRHFSGTRNIEALNWKERPYTFSTECFGCHVNSLSMNYDPKRHTYHNVWESPGVGCESCHGQLGGHERMMMGTPRGQTPTDSGIFAWKNHTTEQKSDTCATCHAKTVPLTKTYGAAQRFFDHFNLITLEDPDFYPDGRIRGENRTYTTFRMSPCFKSGKLSCDMCHEAGGGYRYHDAALANAACLPCHEKYVQGSAAHTHHEEGSAGSRCVSCHMPAIEAGRLKCTDHSMLPPAPGATMKYQSPNACNTCHPDKDAAWADSFAGTWWKKDYQAPVMKRAGLIDEARRGDWTRLPEMLSYILDKDRDEVFASSLLRLISHCKDPRVQPDALKAMSDPSPLVRSAALEALGRTPTREAVQTIIAATGDEFRLVRVSAAEALINSRGVFLPEGDIKKVEGAMREYRDSLTARPDDWASYYNLGDYLLKSGDAKAAVDAYETAIRMEPGSVTALVNLSMAYARSKNSKEAEKSLRKALKIEPGNAAANFNMGLLMAEQKDLKGAQRHLRAALEADPQMADAAFNLGVILFRDKPAQSLQWLEKARSLQPMYPKYAYTLAYYTIQTGRTEEGIRLLIELIQGHPQYVNAYVLLGETFEKQGRKEDAASVYKKGMAEGKIPQPARSFLENKLKTLYKTKDKP